MSTPGPWSSVREITSSVREGRITALALTELALERSRRAQAEFNCFAEIDMAGARAAARAVDERRSRGEKLGPLAGVPVAIKDCTPVAGLGNRFGSHAFAQRVADRDAVVVRRFCAAGAVVIGKTTLSELASSSFCDSPLHGITRNPWNRERTPGGSSGGSAVAVLTGCVAAAEGTDMGGSVRIPASCTGVVGLKPAAGRLPIEDQPSFVDDIQHHGLLTRTVDDLARVLPPLCGPCDEDPTTHVPALPALAPLPDAAGLRVAISNDLGFFVIEPEVRDRLAAAAAALASAGALVSRPSLAWDREIADGWVRHWHVYLAAFFGDALDGLGERADPRLRRVVAQGRAHQAVPIKRLELLRRRQWDALAAIFRQHDVLLSPTMTRPAVGVDEDDARYHVATSDGRKRGLDMTSVFNWVPWCPAISVPAGLSANGLPIGIHLTAPPYREDVLLRAASAVEAVFGRQVPPGW